VVLSDVHLVTENRREGEGERVGVDGEAGVEIKVVTSYLEFVEADLEGNANCKVQTDEDGDHDLIRRPALKAVLLHHGLATPLSHVGLQVRYGMELFYSVTSFCIILRNGKI